MATAFNMHANWRQEDPRRILRLARKHGGTITPYARMRGLRSFIVSWPDGEPGGGDSCEGNLYVIRCHPLQSERVKARRAEISALLCA